MKFLGTQTICFCVVVPAKWFFQLHHSSLRSWWFFGRGRCVFYFVVRKVRLTAARNLTWNRGRNRKRWGRGRGEKATVWELNVSFPWITHNVNTGDKSVWYIFLYTGNIFYVYFTNQTNWIMIYTGTYYLLVCKRFIFFFSCLRTIYFSFFAFANNFFPDFSSPLSKNNGRSLKTISIAKWRHWRIDVSKTSDAQKVEEFRSQLRFRNLSPASL